MAKKIILAVVVLVFVAAVGGIVYVKTNLNSIVKGAMEKYGSQITQTRVFIDDVDISLATGKGAVTGFHVGNPKSYFSATAMEIGKVSLEMDTSSIAGNGPIIIKEVVIDKPDATYEINATGDNNLQTIEKNVSGAQKSGSAAKEKKSGESRKVIIKDLYIRDGHVSVTHALLQGKMVKADLPLIHLRNIGSGGEGATPEQVAAVVMGAIARTASKEGAAALARELPDLKKLGGEAAQGAAGTLKKSLGNILP